MHNEPFYQNIATAIRNYGCSLIGVFDGAPPFTYSIGLSQMKGIGAELILIGLNPQYAAMIFNRIVEEVSMGSKIELDVKDYRWSMDKDGNEMPSMFKAVTKTDLLKMNYGTQAFEFYGRGDIPFYQMVMPDAKGIFPGEEGFDGAYMNHRQPLLY